MGINMRIKTTTVFVFACLFFTMFSCYGRAGISATIETISLREGTFNSGEPIAGGVVVKNTGTAPLYSGHLFIDVTKEKENVFPSKILGSVAYYIIRDVSLLPGEQKSFPLRLNLSASCGKGQYRIWIELSGKESDRLDYKNKEFLVGDGEQLISYPAGMRVYDDPARMYETFVTRTGSTITASAELENLVNKKTDLGIQFTVYNAFDESLWEKPQIRKNQLITLGPREKKNVTVEFTQNLPAGTYGILLNVTKDGSSIAVKRLVNIHVEGAAGSILAAYPDKEAYESGDTMNLHYEVFGPLSPSNLLEEERRFPGSERYQPANTVPTPLNLRMKVEYIKNGIVAQSETKEITIDDASKTPLLKDDWQITIKAPLYNYSLNATLLDEAGNTLDALDLRTYTNIPPKTVETTTPETTTSLPETEKSSPETTIADTQTDGGNQDNPMTGVYILLLLLGVLAVAFIYKTKMEKSKKGRMNLETGKIMLMLLFAAFLAGSITTFSTTLLGGYCQCDEGNLRCSCGNGHPMPCPAPPGPGITIPGASAPATGESVCDGYLIKTSVCSCTTNDQECLFPDDCQQTCCKVQVTDCSSQRCANGNLYAGTCATGACSEVSRGCSTECCQQYCGGNCGECKSGSCVCGFACMSDQDCKSSSDPCNEYLCQNPATCKGTCIKTDTKKPALKLEKSDVQENAGEYQIFAGLKNIGNAGAQIDKVTFNVKNYLILSEPKRIDSGGTGAVSAKSDTDSMQSLPGPLRIIIDYSSEANGECKASSTFDLGGTVTMRQYSKEQLYKMDANGMCVNHYYSCYNSRPDATLYVGYKCFKGDSYYIPTKERASLGYGLKSIPEGVNIRSAILSLKVKNAVKPQSIKVYGSGKDDWAGKPTCEAEGDVCGPSYCINECGALFDIGGGELATKYIADAGQYYFDVTDYVSKEYAGDKYASFQVVGDEDMWTKTGDQSCTKYNDWEMQDVQLEEETALVVTYR